MLTEVVSGECILLGSSGIVHGCTHERIQRENPVIHRSERATLVPAAKGLRATGTHSVCPCSVSCIMTASVSLLRDVNIVFLVHHRDAVVVIYTERWLTPQEDGTNLLSYDISLLGIPA
jgi:hypothetical protein